MCNWIQATTTFYLNNIDDKPTTRTKTSCNEFKQINNKYKSKIQQTTTTTTCVVK